MSAQIVKMIDLLDSFQWLHLCPTVSHIWLQLLFKNRPSPVRCGWNTWQKVQRRRNLEKIQRIYHTCIYIYIIMVCIFTFAGIWKISTNQLKSFRMLPWHPTQNDHRNWLLGYLPTGAPHQTPVGCVTEIFGASSHAVWQKKASNQQIQKGTSFFGMLVHVILFFKILICWFWRFTWHI